MSTSELPAGTALMKVPEADLHPTTALICTFERALLPTSKAVSAAARTLVAEG
jgi:hypothetical protein